MNHEFSLTFFFYCNGSSNTLFFCYAHGSVFLLQYIIANVFNCCWVLWRLFNCFYSHYFMCYIFISCEHGYGKKEWIVLTRLNTFRNSQSQMLFAIANVFLISVELEKFDFFFLKITDAQIYYKGEANLK